VVMGTPTLTSSRFSDIGTSRLRVPPISRKITLEVGNSASTCVSDPGEATGAGSRDATHARRLLQNPPSAAGPFYSSLSFTEIALWCLLYITVLAGILYHAGGPGLSDDSYQYLSEAENIDQGHGLTTSIVHFDTERAHGRVPAPLTTFPPGYSLAIAAISRTGLASETAGLLLSVASLILLVPLIACAAAMLELNLMATRVALVLLLGSFAAGLYATAVATESLFTALALAALVCLLLHERAIAGTPAAVAGNLLVGCACWVRYAGLFLFIAVGTYLVWQAFRRRDRRAVTAAACLVLPAALISSLLLRNVSLTGSWKGGNTKAVTHPLAAVLKQFGVSTYHLFFGEGVPTRLSALQVTLCLGLILLSVLLFVNVARVRSSSGIHTALGSAFPHAGLLLVYVVVYNAGMLYLGMFSVISFGSRMFYPLLPVYLLLSGVVFTRVQASTSARSTPLAWTVCAAIIVGSYWGINLENTIAHRAVSPDRLVASSFALPSETGGTLRSWFDANVPVSATVVATNGQATAYALKRKIVSLVGSNFSEQRWGEEELRTLMQQYDADFLILYPHIDPMIEPVQQESPFLRALIAGQRPQWLQLAAENSQVMIFRCPATWAARSRKN
jgi:hypothetical protein